MSSPNHSTSNIEDAFSSNFLDFIPASPDYVPASLGKTYSSSSNSFGVVPIASPSLSLFYDDPYMKVMHASLLYVKMGVLQIGIKSHGYREQASPDCVPASLGKTYSSSSNSFGVYAKKSPILPPIITPPSSVPNPQEFFLPEELLSPKKQGHDQSFSSTSTLP
nr:hypothetical protein [Tanacetum cinerariifolium]